MAVKTIRGEDVDVYVLDEATLAYVLYICATDVTIDIDMELIEKTTVRAGRFYDFHSRRKGWSVSISGVSAVVGTGRTVFETVDPDTIFDTKDIKLVFTDKDGNAATFTGTVLLENASLGGNVDDWSVWENGFRGTGAYVLTSGVTPPAGPGISFVSGDDVMDFVTSGLDIEFVSG